MIEQSNPTPEAPKPDKGGHLTRKILIGLCAGAILGSLLNFTKMALGEDSAATTVIDQYVAGGLFHFVGQAFFTLLKMLVVPLVFVSLVCGTAALDDVSRLGRIGLKTVALYLGTTAMALILALGIGLLVKPGADPDAIKAGTFDPPASQGIMEVLLNLFPSNPVEALAEGNMLQIIVFAILFGLALTLSGAPGKRLLAIFDDLNEAVLKLVGIVMELAPYGVFALVAKTFTLEGFGTILDLAAYFFTVLAVLLIHGLVVYPTILSVLGRMSPWPFLRKMRPVQLFAFSTSSSGATIPVTLRAVEKTMGAPNRIASFTIPLGATINMDGTAIMQGVAVIFIAQVSGITLDPSALLMVILLATLASIGTAGVPSAGLVMLTMVLTEVGLPIEAISLIIGIDRLLDMTRTAVNVTGDAAVTCIVAKSEGELDEAIYASADSKEG